MITPMKKYSFLVYHLDYHDFVTQLGNLGVLHVIERENPGREESLSDITTYLKELNTTLGLFKWAREKYDSNGGVRSDTDMRADEVVEEAGKLRKKIEVNEGDTVITETAIEQLAPWGNYSSDDLRRLEEKGYRMILYSMLRRDYNPEWEERYSLFTINQDASHIWFAAVVPEGEEPEIDATPVKPAVKSLEEFESELKRQREEMLEAGSRLAYLGERYEERIRGEIGRTESNMALRKVYLDTLKESGDTLRILEGWVPSEHEEEVIALSENAGAVSIVTTPEEGEMPPVQLRNSHFSKLFEPISKLFDLPNYGELDLTPYFAPFFMIFFGFCLGDAGYGVVFILLGAILKLKLGKKHEMRPILTLGQYFGVATILFGLISGTFFGINLIDSGYTLTAESIEILDKEGVPDEVLLKLEDIKDEYYNSRSGFRAALENTLGEPAAVYGDEVIKSAEAGIPFVRGFRHLMQEPLSMFYLAILIGAMQIIFGIFLKVMNITRRRGFRYALSSVGWLVLIVALVLKETGLMDATLLTWLWYGMLGVAGLFILVLNKPGAGIIARVGGGIWDSYNMVTGIFGDLLSYIRLFALGISSAILGFVFNDISLQLLSIPWIGWFFFLVILVAGHSINLFLATLGGFIHPMRLTFVEFYKNAGFEGGGKEYKPFSINN
ncbi:MAG: V-type ATP synthase subunit I [Bacteroidales bacterium]